MHFAFETTEKQGHCQLCREASGHVQKQPTQTVMVCVCKKNHTFNNDPELVT